MRESPDRVAAVSAQAWLLLGTVITAAAGVLTTWLLIRQQGRQTKTTDAQQIIDQLQENAAAAEARHQQATAAQERRHQQEIAALRGELSAVTERMDGMEDREMVLLDYAAALRAHIDRGDPPPPPRWPETLMRHRRRQ